jgi:hypothetical protein
MPPYDTHDDDIWELIKKDLDDDAASWYKDNVVSGYVAVVEEIMRQRLTAEQRLEFKRARQSLVGSLITQEGSFCGALVKEHVRGSQYVVRMADGTEVFASHKKRLEGQRGLSGGGWQAWEDRR